MSLAPSQPTASRRLTAARLTPVGRGAVATIRVCDEPFVRARPGQQHTSDENCFVNLNSVFRAANGIPLDQQPLTKIAFGQWGTSDFEELVVVRISLGILEIHCHGGDVAVQRILKDLSNAGYDVVDWRHQSAQGEDPFDVECLDVLGRTSTWRTTSIVLEQATGLLRRTFQSLLESCSGDETPIEARLDELLEWAEFGKHLSEPWSLVMTGRPNVGKSSLTNALLGYQRAIVFDQPGTTRDVVTGETAFDGWPVVISDTAGIRQNAADLEATGIAYARKRLQTADLRLVVIDIGLPPSVDDRALLAEWPDALVVAHKSDLKSQWSDLLPDDAVRVSSITSDGLPELQRRLVDRLVPRVPKAGTPIPITDRQVELLRIARSASTRNARQKVLGELVFA